MNRRGWTASLGRTAGAAAAAWLGGGALLLVIASPVSTAAAAQAIPAPASKDAHVVVEPIQGTGTKRVTLSPRAAERLGIRLGQVSEGIVPRRHFVGGVVVAPADLSSRQGGRGFGAFVPPQARSGAANALPAAPLRPGAAPASADGAAPLPRGELWVRVSLSPAEWARVAADRPARVIALPGREPFTRDLVARPSGMPPAEDPRHGMLRVHYVLSGGGETLMPDTRVRVELEHAGDDKPARVVPYAAVYYDGRGDAWVYASPAPLVYERRPVAVERIVGDIAVLSEGPAVGTSVAVVGASLLYGAEILGK